MLTFDRIKVISPYKGIVTDLNGEHYEVIQKGSHDKQWYYKSRYSDTLPLPFDLFIKIDHEKNELVMELPAKLLADDYPDLISLNNISTIIENLKALTIIEIDFNSWFQNAQVLAVDVTYDLDFRLTTSDYKYFNNLILNPRKWKIDDYFNGVEFLSKNNTRNRRVNLKIYGKGFELLMNRNKEFLNWIGDKNGIINFFSEKTRIEFEIRSFEMLRKYFKTKDLSLNKILDSDTNPIAHILSEVIDLDIESVQGNFLLPLEEMSIWEAKDYLILKQFDFDLDRVYDFLKLIMSAKSKPKLALAKYRNILAKIDDQKLNKSKGKVLEFVEMIKE